MSTNPQTALQQALATIEAQFQEAEKAIQKMAKDQSQIQHDESKMAYDKAHWTYTTSSAGPHPVYHHHNNTTNQRDYHNCTDDINAMNADIDAQKTIIGNAGPAFAALNQSLDALIATANALIASGFSHDGSIADDLDQINQKINQIFEAMKDAVHAHLYEAAMHGKMSGDFSISDLAQLAQGELENSSEALTMVDKVIDGIKKLGDKIAGDERELVHKLSHMSALESFFGDTETLTKLMNLENEIEKDLVKVLDKLSVAKADLQPEFMSVINTIEQIVKQAKKIISDAHLSPKAKISQLLALVMYLLSFSQTLKQKVENEKMEQNQTMTKSTIHTTKENLAEIQSQRDAEEGLEQMKKTNKMIAAIIEAIMGAILIISSGGVGAAVVAGLCTTYEELNTCGVINTNEDLGNAMHSQIGADVVIGVTEGLATFGAGAAIDVGLEKAMAKSSTAAAKTVMDDVEKTVAAEADKIAQKEADRAASQVVLVDMEPGSEAAQQIVQAARKAAYDQAYTAAYNTLERIAENAAKKAAERAGQQFLKQQFGSLMELVGTGQFKQELSRLMEAAAKDAATDAIQEAESLAKLAARGVASTDEIEEGIAVRNANNSVSKVSRSTPEKVEDGADNMGWGKWRLVSLIVAGMLSNNTFVEGVKKMGASDDAWYTQLLSVIQMLMQMIAMMVGTGTFASVTMEGVMTKLPRYANLLSLIPQGVQAGNDIDLSETLDAQGKAVTAIQKLDGESSLLSDFLQMLQKDSHSWDNMVKEVEQDRESTSAMAGHMQDGETAEINVMLASIG
ncbi:MAG: hypothetical protein K1X28_05590 [Parachlamydiales bacterium]|nr:hypothetical protein [Parachlamydiales bacterium]